MSRPLLEQLARFAGEVFSVEERRFRHRSLV
jgi:hypothetical protein